MCLLSTKFILVFIVIWNKFIPAQVYLGYPDKMRFVSCGNLFHVFYFVFWKISSITVPGKVFISKIPPVSKQDLTKFVNAEARAGGPRKILGTCLIILQFLWNIFKHTWVSIFMWLASMQFLGSFVPILILYIFNYLGLTWSIFVYIGLFWPQQSY